MFIQNMIQNQVIYADFLFNTNQQFKKKIWLLIEIKTVQAFRYLVLIVEDNAISDIRTNNSTFK